MADMAELLEGLAWVADTVGALGVREQRDEDQRLLLLGILDRVADRRSPRLERSIHRRARRSDAVRIDGEAGLLEVGHDARSEASHVRGRPRLVRAVPDQTGLDVRRGD